MNKHDIESIGVTVVLLGLGVLLFNPMNWFMSNMTVMVIVASLLASFALFVGLIWRESAQDEREELHRMATDRIAFLVGVGVLVGIVAAQGLTHTVDPWAVIVLGGMVLAKAGTRIYFQMRH